MALGVANGCIVDADVMSGNYDDKTFNSDKIDTLEMILDNTNTCKENFYYIADNAAFSYDNFKEIQNHKLKMITKLSETTKLCKKIINDVSEDITQLEEVKLLNSKGVEVIYGVKKENLDYKSLSLNCAICYSNTLFDVKSKSINKKIEKEFSEVQNLSKKYKTRKFACLEDAEKEIKLLLKNRSIKNPKFLDV
ncbi:MAG: hypothetical protein RSD77_10465 [Romboutsia sp.]